MKKEILLLIMLFNAATVPGQPNTTDDYKVSTFAIFFDNDYVLELGGLGRLNEDRNYTMGLGLLYASNRLYNCVLFAPLHGLNTLIRQRELNNAANMRSVILANGSFTPDDLRQQNAIYTDRPYGSITALQTMITGFAVNNGAIDLSHRKTTSLSLGIIGTALAKTVQTKLHNAFNNNNTKPPYNPEGWHNQISSNGEPTLLYTMQHDYLLGAKKKIANIHTHGWGLQAKGGYRYTIGYHTGINALLQCRAGFINKKNWFIDVNNLQNTNKMLVNQRVLAAADSLTLLNNFADNETKLCKRSKIEVFVFGAVRPQVLLYNALLNGQFKRSVHTLSFQQTRHLLLEADAGAGASFPFRQGRNLADIRCRISTRSPETNITGIKDRWHFWGGIEFSTTFY